MKHHLAFLRTYREAFRLKLNAAEDLLVNGQREPRDRGVCHHLLAKVDRSAIDLAVQREPLRSDATARARMLAGAVRVTADVGVLLAYLETLAQVRSRPEAAQAFAEVVQRIDFGALSGARLGRLLQVLLETFVDHERVQVLFGLLATPSFTRAFDAAVDGLPPAVAEVCAPLRAVHRRLLGDASSDAAPALVAGMALVLSAPDPILRAYPPSLRERLLGLALEPFVPPALADRAAGALLRSLDRAGRPYAQLALRRAAQLLRRHADDRARATLDDLHRAQAGLRTVDRWLAALDARRLGRIAVTGGPPSRGRLAPAFWLDGQQPVWVRSAPADHASRLASEARHQRDVALPGVALVVEDGDAEDAAYVAVAGPGRPLDRDTIGALDAAAAFGAAAAAARVLRGVALAGFVLPDADPRRWLYTPATGPVLADLDGVEATEPSAATRRHAALATALAEALVPPAHRARLEPDEQARLADGLGADDVATVAAALERAAARVVP